MFLFMFRFFFIILRNKLTKLLVEWDRYGFVRFTLKRAKILNTENVLEINPYIIGLC